MEEQYQGAFLAASVRLFDVWGRARQTYFSLYGVFTSVFFGAIFFFCFLTSGATILWGPPPLVLPQLAAEAAFSAPIAGDRRKSKGSRFFSSLGARVSWRVRGKRVRSLISSCGADKIKASRPSC